MSERKQTAAGRAPVPFIKASFTVTSLGADVLAATSSLQMGREPVQSKQNELSRPVCGRAF